ncbi:member of major facilitator superfamily multidrug-resistance, DHA1 sub-family [Crepidotus variabilis]|uniref:Member of major facilitator superfamily multidrug-resistance, DHA1 sub-family n=1 Tax=Crepidotus variabilis TaxID=179855 RepID=A0A9P6ECR7_9AGAR|nr:member of major facilitator superfamily multidrug-resistance, DHA1 sub-family [Crepidotus variabilis]
MTSRADEEAPLLQGKRKPTPLPWSQFSIILFLLLADPLTTQVISPFAPQLIRDIGITNGNESQVGYYVGIMQSFFFLTQACTVLHWSRLSDSIGRKPVILCGLVGLSLSTYCFGLSRSFWGLVLSGSLNGALNGNLGVIKSMMAEMTDPTNISKAYAYLPIVWTTGSTLGPIIGGLLSRPADRFPNVFGNSEFMKKYPYFLPCSVPATFSVSAWIIAFFFLKETSANPQSIAQYLGFRERKTEAVENPVIIVTSTEEEPLITTEPRNLDGEALSIDEPLPLRSLLTHEVVIAATNYAFLSLVDIGFRAVHPLFLSTPIELGGFGLPPATIGKVLSLFAVLDGLFQVFFFAKIYDRWGPKRVFIAGVLSTIPAFMLFPIINALARHQGYSLTAWAAVVAQITMFVAVNCSFGAIYIFIAAASPNRASLGATNGFSEMTVSFMRAIGPAITNSLFSLSMAKGYLGGYLVYFILLLFTGLSLCIGWLLPRHIHSQL